MTPTLPVTCPSTAVPPHRDTGDTRILFGDAAAARKV